MLSAIPSFFLYAVVGIGTIPIPLILRGMGYSVLQVGFLMSIFELSGHLCPLVASPALQRYGKYGRVLLAAGIIALVMPVPFVLLRGFGWTALALGIYALAPRGSLPCMDSITTSMIADKPNRYGVVRGIGSLGYVILLVTLQFTTDLGSAGPAGIIAWMCIPALLLILAVVLVPGVLAVSTGPRKTVRDTSGSTFSGLTPAFWLGIGLIFCAYLSLSPVNRFLTLYVEEDLGLHVAAILYALSAAVEIPVMMFSSRLLKHFSAIRVICLCTAAITPRLLVYILFPTLHGQVAGQMLHCLNYGLIHPAAIFFVTRNVPKEKLLIGLSIYQLVGYGFANVLGAALGGVIIENFGYRALFLFFATLPPMALGAYCLVRKKVRR
ncbi:MAG: MFS transporter [Spirochaetaceae bacterium]|jgi:PPP family 3-phenylpropionic acid transporter|nr:MFS transporter [Spirochaetaceae bacterium]